MSVFGGIVTTDEVEDAVIAQLQAWLPSYLAQIERDKNLAAHTLPMTRSWNVMPDVEKWPENQLPALIVVSPGTTGAPIRRSHGVYSATYGLAVAWYVTGWNEDASRRLNRWYAGAIRALLLQHKPVVAGETCATVWTDEDLDALPALDSRTIQVGRNVFEITVDHVVDETSGPLTVSDDPYASDAYPDAVTVASTFADGDKE